MNQMRTHKLIFITIPHLKQRIPVCATGMPLVEMWLITPKVNLHALGEIVSHIHTILMSLTISVNFLLGLEDVSDVGVHITGLGTHVH